MPRPTAPLILAALASIAAAPPVASPLSDEPPREDSEGRVAWWHKQRAFPANDIPLGAWARARDPYKKQPRAGDMASWLPIGPSPLEVGKGLYATPNMGPLAGRASAIAVDPSDPKILYAGYALGGVWKSIDGGATFTPLMDLEPTLAVGAIALDPKAPSTIYVGTGEPAPYIGHAGQGILRSIDGGKTFEKIGGTTFDGVAVGRIVIDAMAGAIYATSMFGARGRGLSCTSNYDAPNQGVYRSTDGGSTWISLKSGPIVDLEIDLQKTPRRLLISDYNAGASYSDDGGATWAVPAGLPNDQSTPAARRIELSLSASNPSVVYAGLGVGSSAAVYLSIDGGHTFGAMPGAPDYCEGQCYYDNAVAVDPKDEKTVFLGGGLCGVWKTSNGTDAAPTWTNVSLPSHDCKGGATWASATVHPDIHAITFDPANSSVVYVAGDGGIARTTDGGDTWSRHNAGVGTLQIYAMCAAPNDASAIYGGTQDNGIFRKSGDAWRALMTGDGGSCAVDPKDPNLVLATTAYASVLRTKDAFTGTPSFVFSAQSGLCGPLDPGCGDRTSFIAPLVGDPSTPGTFYVGTYRVFKTANGGTTFSALSGDLTAGVKSVACPNAPSFGKLDDALTAIAVAPSAPLVMYTGSEAGLIHTTRDGGTTWTRADKAPLPGRWVSAIAVDPKDANVVFASFSGFDESTPNTPGHVFRSADGGATWEVRGIGFDTPVDTLIAHPVASDVLYAGTDAGVLHTTDGGQTWAPIAGGLPSVPVYSLLFHRATGSLLAGTFGRSAWSLTLPVGGLSVVPDSLSFEVEEGQTAKPATLRISATDARGGITPFAMAPGSVWMSLDRWTGEVSGAAAVTVSMSVATAGMKAGVQKAALTLYATAGGTPIEVPVTLTIKAATTAPPPGATPTKNAKDGCGCRTAGTAAEPAWPLFGTFAAMMSIVARRARRRVAAVCSRA